VKGEKRVERLESRVRETYRALKALEEELGAPPTVREVVDRLGLTKRHISRVHGDLVLLAKLGRVRDLDIKSRTFSARDGPAADEVDWEALLRE
jgi:2-hydroxychromene-2-carboxylate isomerase